MPANFIFLLFTLPALLTSCGSTDPIDEIEIAKKTWEAAGIKNYRADVERICFCPPPSRYTMVVEDGVINRIIDNETGEETEQRNGYATVDKLFDWLLQVAPKNPEKLDLEFHPELGYPTLVDYNQSDMISDEELVIRITDVREG